MQYRRQKLLLFVALATACLAIAVFAIFGGGSLMRWKSTLNKNESEKAIDLVKEAFRAEVEIMGQKDYPWGSVQVYEGRTTSDERLVVELDRFTETVRSIETYGRYPTNVKINSEEALHAAQQFVAVFAPDLTLRNLQITLDPPSEEATIKVYRIAWQRVAATGARLPEFGVIYVDAETGKVSDFIFIEWKTTVDVEPQISAEQALEIVSQAAIESDIQFERAGEVDLMVIPFSSSPVAQSLAWVIPYWPKPGDSLVSTIAVDAHSGEIIDMDVEEP